MLDPERQKMLDDMLAMAKDRVSAMSNSDRDDMLARQKENLAPHVRRERTTTPIMPAKAPIMPPKAEPWQPKPPSTQNRPTMPDDFVSEDRQPMTATPCKIEPRQPMRVGPLIELLASYDSFAHVIGRGCSPYMVVVKQNDGSILIAEECDFEYGKTIEDCRNKFDNLNFRGFPDPTAEIEMPKRKIAECGTPLGGLDFRWPNPLLSDKPPIKISVYLDDGVVREYHVASAISAREHVAAIVNTGYRSVEGDKLTHYPPHRITKVVAQGEGISTAYPDTARGT